MVLLARRAYWDFQEAGYNTVKRGIKELRLLSRFESYSFAARQAQHYRHVTLDPRLPSILKGWGSYHFSADLCLMWDWGEL